jgi:hypothetical protein
MDYSTYTERGIMNVFYRAAVEVEGEVVDEIHGEFESDHHEDMRPLFRHARNLANQVAMERDFARGFSVVVRSLSYITR